MSRYYRFIKVLVPSSMIGTMVYYRPLPDEMVNRNGPSRANKHWTSFISNKNLSDHSSEKPPVLYRLCQSIIVFATVSVTRAFLMYGGKFKIIKDEHYSHFLSVMSLRDERVGVVTVSNHRSLFDDPSILSSILPYWMNIQPKYLRWNVCAQEFCFNTVLPSLIHAYIGIGKTLPIWRGGGVNQKLLLDFARHLAAGEWLHIFPEAGIYQKDEIGGRKGGTSDDIGKLKWGVGKIIAHAPTTPIVIPFFHNGMEKVIPQDQVTLKTVGMPIPRPGHDVTVRFGPQLSFTDLIDEHVKVHGPLWKYTATASDDNADDDFHKSWDSSPAELVLYSKITRRIEAALTSLNNQSNQDLLLQHK